MRNDVDIRHRARPRRCRLRDNTVGLTRVLGCSWGSCAAPDRRGIHADHLRRSLLLDVVEASRRRLLRSSAWLAVVIRLGTLIAGDTEFGVRLVSILLALPMSWAIYQAAAILFGSRRVAASSAILLNVTLMAAVGTMIVTPDAPLLVASSLAAVCARQGAADRARRVVAGGRRRRRLRAAVEIHRAVLRAGDPDLAGRRSQTAALADLAVALSRRAGRGCCCLRRSFSGTPSITGSPSSSRWGGRGSRISARSSSPN